MYRINSHDTNKELMRATIFLIVLFRLKNSYIQIIYTTLSFTTETQRINIVYLFSENTKLCSESKIHTYNFNGFLKKKYYVLNYKISMTLILNTIWFTIVIYIHRYTCKIVISCIYFYCIFYDNRYIYMNSYDSCILNYWYDIQPCTILIGITLHVILLTHIQICFMKKITLSPADAFNILIMLSDEVSD